LSLNTDKHIIVVLNIN